MSRPTPDDEYAAGIVSRANQAPLAKLKKSTQALTPLSMNDGSITLSGESAFCAASPDGASASRRGSTEKRAWRRRAFGFIVGWCRSVFERTGRFGDGQRDSPTPLLISPNTRSAHADNRDFGSGGRGAFDRRARRRRPARATRVHARRHIARERWTGACMVGRDLLRSARLGESGRQQHPWLERDHLSRAQAVDRDADRPAGTARGGQRGAERQASHISS